MLTPLSNKCFLADYGLDPVSGPYPYTLFQQDVFWEKTVPTIRLEDRFQCFPRQNISRNKDLGADDKIAVGLDVPQNNGMFSDRQRFYGNNTAVYPA